MASAPWGTRRPTATGGEADHPGRTAAILPGARRLAAFVRRCARRWVRSCDHGSARARGSRWSPARWPVSRRWPARSPPTGRSRPRRRPRRRLLFGWTFEPLPTLGLLAVTVWWWWAVRRVNAAPSRQPGPRRRSVAFYGGIVALAFALLSGIARYDTSLFSVHMVQHVLLMLVAAPLLALAAPITLVLRLSSSETRHRWLLPVLHSRIVRFLAFPVVGLGDVHGDDVGGPLLAAVQRVARGPAGPRLRALPVPDRSAPVLVARGRARPGAVADGPSGAGSCYLFTQMTQNTFLAVVILNATDVLYPHYATLVRPWGMAAIDDQRLAAGIMWIAGDADLPDARSCSSSPAGCAPRRATRPVGPAGRRGAGPDPDPRAAPRRAAGRRAGRAGRVGRGSPGRRRRRCPAEGVAQEPSPDDSIKRTPPFRPRPGPPGASAARCRCLAGRIAPSRAARACSPQPSGGIGASRYPRYSSGSTFPPLTTATTDPSTRSSPSSPAWNAMRGDRRARPTARRRAGSARPPAAPPAAISASLTVTIEVEQRTRRCANVRTPSAWVRVPSAMVRDTWSAGQRHDLAALEGVARVGGELGLDADHAGVGAQRPDRDRHPARQPAATDRDEDGGEVRQVLRDLEPDRPLTGDDPVVVEGRDDRRSPRRAAISSATWCRSSLAGADDDDLGAVLLDPRCA